MSSTRKTRMFRIPSTLLMRQTRLGIKLKNSWRILKKRQNSRRSSSRRSARNSIIRSSTISDSNSLSNPNISKKSNWISSKSKFGSMKSRLRIRKSLTRGSTRSTGKVLPKKNKSGRLLMSSKNKSGSATPEWIIRAKSFWKYSAASTRRIPSWQLLLKTWIPKSRVWKKGSNPREKKFRRCT